MLGRAKLFHLIVRYWNEVSGLQRGDFTLTPTLSRQGRGGKIAVARVLR